MAYGREYGKVQAPPALQSLGITAVYGGAFSMGVRSNNFQFLLFMKLTRRFAARVACNNTALETR
jgi:hypothetical protein